MSWYRVIYSYQKNISQSYQVFRRDGDGILYSALLKLDMQMNIDWPAFSAELSAGNASWMWSFMSEHLILLYTLWINVAAARAIYSGWIFMATRWGRMEAILWHKNVPLPTHDDTGATDLVRLICWLIDQQLGTAFIESYYPELLFITKESSAIC